MPYSINPILHPYADKHGLHKVILQIIYNRMKVYEPTIAKVPGDNFLKGVIIKHKSRKAFNDSIDKQRNEIESKILTAASLDRLKTKSDLVDIIKGKVNKSLIYDYILDLITKLQGKMVAGRLKHYKVVAGKIEDFQPKVTFGEISVKWLNDFEAYLRGTGIDGNTVLTNMSLVLAILNRGNAEDLIDQKQYKKYKRPAYNQKLVEYLTEEELLKVKAAVDLTDKPGAKRAGYYFLLSSFTGFRFSDSSRFNYDDMVKDNMVVLQAIKNQSIISIPLYPQLREILDFVKHHPLDLSNDKTRQHIQEICKFIGIKKKINFHTSRHSFGMFLLTKGFSIDDVAALIGDTKTVTKVYAKISNQHLKTKFSERLG